MPTQQSKEPDPLEVLTNLLTAAKDMHQAQHSPYQEGVAKALKDGGQKHTLEALSQGVPADHIAQQAGLNPQATLQALVSKPQNFATPPNNNILTKLMGAVGFRQSGEEQNQQAEAALKRQKLAQGGNNPEAAISRIAGLNQAIDKALPGYQATQNANGDFLVHPKAAGTMNMLSPEEMDSVSDSLISGETVPSQLPRNQKNQVIAEALQKDPNYSPAKADMEFAANKIGAGSFKKNFFALDSYHGDFEKNADYVLGLSGKYLRTSMPLINKALVMGQKVISGNPQASQLLQSVNAISNVWAKLQNPTLTGQALSDAARKEGQNLIDAFQSDEVLHSLLDKKDGSMRVEANNRIDAAQEEMDKIDNLYGKKKSQASGDEYDQYLKSIGQ